MIRRQVSVLLLALLLWCHGECTQLYYTDDSRLYSVVNELLELRSALSQLFQSPIKAVETRYPSISNREWVVRVDGGAAEAHWLANMTGTRLVGPMHGLSDFFIFQSYDETWNGSDIHRIKRDLSNDQSSSYHYWSELQIEKQRHKRDVPDFNDPLWQFQWEVNGRNQKGSMRIAEAWAEGYTGENVVISILDDGIDYRHQDLHRNYDPKASYDLNDNDSDPTPKMDKFNKHGTRCAGEIAMLPNNSMCGVGVAYNAKIGGIRMLDGRINDRLEAEALSILLGHADIMSSSWGPQDDGKTVEGPDRLAALAFKKGVEQGRAGKGAIYVWASGNGGPIDDCVCDGYASSIYTFTVSSATSTGGFPWYGEHCAAALASTFSSGANRHKKIVTVDPQNRCTTNHTGTSAAAPIAAGIIALALQANPSLTWREIQHLAVWTSDPEPMFKVPGWQMNGAGLWSNPKFGFGLMDALEMTRMARDFKHLDVQHICTTTFPTFQHRRITSNTGIVLSFVLNACHGTENEIGSLEHVQVVADIASKWRGLLSIWLESPTGMRSQLLHPRMQDKSKDGFDAWPFTSVQFWGENPIGLWKLHVDQMHNHQNKNTLTSTLKNVTIILYGTTNRPVHALTPRLYPNTTINRMESTQATFLANEKSINITEAEHTVREARDALTRVNANTELHLLAVNRLVRRINRMNLNTERRREVAHLRNVDEK